MCLLESIDIMEDETLYGRRTTVFLIDILLFLRVYFLTTLTLKRFESRFLSSVAFVFGDPFGLSKVIAPPIELLLDCINVDGRFLFS